ncbi:MAG: DUF952 domain-containing protein [Pseudomonadota bacterium]
MQVYKIMARTDWDMAQKSGFYAGAPIDIEDGFIHFSTAEQAQETAEKHFFGQTDLMLVAVDASHYGADMKWEASRGGALFPHLYGAFDMASVTWARAMITGDDGVPMLPALHDNKTSKSTAETRGSA